MTDLFDRLQATLGEDAYKLEHELGGGGMSQVFVATEVELGRKVVIKVLPPDMAAGVNKERFQREIKLAASLQHPHVVQLFSAGSAGDLLWYIMPYIEGESLRHKLAREGELPIEETVQILTEVMDALAYAHESEVVHRDIKPDNVMISRGHALVMDFGVAKAVSASSGGTASSITSIGVALGTPAYMSPEQAAADPHVDHRADIYAVGALAYEMLTGRPPFVKQTPQQTLAAHVNEEVEHVTAHRRTVPSRLAEIVMRCLAKRAADRWQSATELRNQFIAAVTPDSGGMTPTGTQPIAAYGGGTAGALKMLVNTPLKLAGVYAGGAAFVLLFAYAVTIAFGLPTWVFYGAIGLAVIGFPIVMLTGRREQEIVEARTTGMHTATPVGIEKHLTWKKALTGGGMAFGGLAVVAGGFMGMRSAGIGPAATLMTSGAFDQQEELILADFANRTTDSTLGETVTELIRISFSQSTVVELVDPARISESLVRMQRPADAAVPEPVAVEIAERDGFKAVLTGEVAPLGGGYLVSTRLISADGEVLAAQQASAAGPNEIIGAVDELTNKMRERIGESLREIRRTVPLDFITTGSIDALRLYTQSAMAEVAGDMDRALDLLEQATVRDTAFGMAYRKIATIINNDGSDPARAIAAATRAYELRDRMTARERAYATAAYHSQVTGDYDAGLSAFRTLLDTYPNDHRALNNSGVLYMFIGDMERAAEYWLAGVDSDSTWPIGFTNSAFAQAAIGDTAGARNSINEMAARFGADHALVIQGRGDQAYQLGDRDSAQMYYEQLMAQESGSQRWQAAMLRNLAQLHITQGRPSVGVGLMERSRTTNEQRGLPSIALLEAFQTAHGLIPIDPEAARRLADETLQRIPFEELALANREYGIVSRFYLDAGDTVTARQYLAEFEQSDQAALGKDFERDLLRTQGRLRAADGDLNGGLQRYREGADGWPCHSCKLYEQARMFDEAGHPDSAIVYFEAYLNSGFRGPAIELGLHAASLVRVGELHEAAGNDGQAAAWYSDFVDLWEDADPELQSRVADIRQRIARLVGEGR